MHCKIVHKGNQVNADFNLNFNLGYKIKSIHPNKIKNKLCVKTINYAFFKLEEKPTINVQKNKRDFIKTKGDKFAMIIR